MKPALDERARRAGETLRAAAELRPLTTPSRRTRPVRRIALATAAAVLCVAVGLVVAFRSPSRAPVAGVDVSPAGSVADLAWTRVAAPLSGIRRIVSANGHTYALPAFSGDGLVVELAPGAAPRIVLPAAPGQAFESVNDIIGTPAGLVAVGSDADGAAAWRSTDKGSTWQRVAVEQPPVGATSGHGGPLFARVSISRVITARGTLYAFGQSVYDATDGRCPRAAWTSSDGAHFALVPPDSPIACGGSDATDGPAGFVSIKQGRAVAIVDGVEHVISPGSSSVNAIASDDHGYVAVGAANIRDETPSPAAIWRSPDGKNWTPVVTASTADHNGSARFTGVVHAPGGWIAVGYGMHPGADGKVNDAILWTSRDGEHWVKDTRDAGTFEQFAQANGIGVTEDGFAIFGYGNVTGGRVAAEPLSKDPLAVDNVLWLGTNAPSTKPLGTVEGTLREVGGPAPGIDRAVAGSLIATGTDGSKFTATVSPAGRFSTSIPPGRYHVVGHSPQYGDGTYDCEAGGPVVVEAYTATHIDLICPLR